MRSIRLEPKDFESDFSEETLALDIAGRGTCEVQSLAAFVQALEGVPAAVLDAALQPLGGLRQYPMVRDHLAQFAQIELGDASLWQVCCVDEPEWNDVHLLLISDAYFIRYHWFTTA